MTRRWPVLMAMVVAAAHGCGASLQDVTDKHGRAASDQLARLEKVLDHCRSLEPLEEDLLPEHVKGVVFVDRHDRPEGNARTIWLDAHDKPADYFEPIHWSYRAQDEWWSQTSKALSADPADLSGKELERLDASFAELASTEYVLVIKTLEYRAPRHIEGTNRFELGAMRGEAHLYRLADATRLAAITYGAFGQALAGALGMDFTLDATRPKAAVGDLTNRLYGSIHEYAQGRLAAKAPGVDSIFEIHDRGPFLAPEIRRRSATTRSTQ